MAARVLRIKVKPHARAASFVQQVDGTSFVVNTCAPDLDCSLTLIRVTIAAPDLQLGIGILDIGSLVHVHFVGYCFYGGHASIVVSSLDTWGGVRNAWPPRGGGCWRASRRPP